MEAVQKITLKNNSLRFSALEAGKGPLVLCLHGFPDNYHSYDQQIPTLVDAGYRVVAPMMRGYEPQSQPSDGDYHLNKMVEDILTWIDQLGEEKVHLVGHDWGAVIGYLTANTAPERLLSLTTFAIPPLQGLPIAIRKNPRQVLLSWYTLFFQLRGLSDWWVERSDWKFLEKLWHDWSPGWAIPPHTLESVRQTFSQPGVKKAALNYYRHSFDSRSPQAKEIARTMALKTTTPTLAVGGWDDGCMSAKLYDAAARPEDFPAGLRVERINGAGHFLHQEQPAIVNELLLSWLNRYND
ncbi:MAG: alpha/beta hydrolase [Proteobacteria bacterium]|nr:alpha/beta hydrolase [Pseudomonadota bacterium]